MSRYPFEASASELEAELERFVDTVFVDLESEFLILPRGPDFVDYAAFEQAFQLLKQSSKGFTSLDPVRIAETVREAPLTLIVLRTILGFTPSEWAHVASLEGGARVDQSYARSVERGIRRAPLSPLRSTNPRLEAMVLSACKLLTQSAPATGEGRIHRLDKADTKRGLESIRHLSEMGAPYAMLLYERFLGRPFAGHRDAISELVGEALEVPIEEILTREGINYRKTKRAAQVPGFDQAPDFIIPDEFNPRAVIEAKLAEDDGTARDKVTRVQHLASLSEEGQMPGERRFEVIACIAGRGFKVRRSNMKKLLLATRGKVFTLKTLDRLVSHTTLKTFRTSPQL